MVFLGRRVTTTAAKALRANECYQGSTMIAGAISGLIIVLIAVAYSKLGKNGQEHVKKAGNVAGWLFGISVLVALVFSAYLTLSK